MLAGLVVSARCSVSCAPGLRMEMTGAVAAVGSRHRWAIPGQRVQRDTVILQIDAKRGQQHDDDRDQDFLFFTRFPVGGNPPNLDTVHRSPARCLPQRQDRWLKWYDAVR